MNALIQLIFNPALLSLVVGIGFGFFNLIKFPRKIIDLVSVYLIFAIGFKGGLSLGSPNNLTSDFYGLVFLGIILGFIQPFINNFILKKSTNLDKVNRVVIATQYGSISIVTFITAVTFLVSRNIAYDTFMPAVAGLMELPALFSGLILLDNKKDEISFLKSLLRMIKSILTCKTIVFIFVGFFTGLIFKNFNLNYFNGLILYPFNIILILFMLEIGIKIANQREHIKKISPALIAFGIYMPIISGSLAVLLGYLFVNSLGSLILFALLVASASYIAVPAVMRNEAKGAKEAIYLPLALAVTLPFNILVGIPLFYYQANLLIKLGLLYLI